MVTTRSGGGNSPPPDRTALQLQRDKIAAEMDMAWSMSLNRPHVRSRGINNGLNLCYQNAVLQALMHQPPFLNWILQHNTGNTPCNARSCLKCPLKRLARVYWRSTNTTNPIVQQGCVQDIARLSFNSQRFVSGSQDDAFLFYNWIFDDLRVASTDPAANLQFETTYSLTLQHHDRCTTCGTPHSSATVSDETSMSIGVDLNHTSVQQAIAASLQHSIDDVRCEECNGNQVKTRWTEIVAAPKILRIHLQIIQPQHKIFHHLTHPDLLDLTAHQQNPTLPLQYQLSSVIAHNGDYGDSEERDHMEALCEELPKDADSDFEESQHGTDDIDSSSPTNPAASDQTKTSDANSKALSRKLHPPPKVMTGHYIASVREPNSNRFSCINDSRVTNISHQAFLANPQNRNRQRFEAYVLTYIRNDSERSLPAQIPERWMKEITQLKTGKGAIEPLAYPIVEPLLQVVYPTVEPRYRKEPSRKRAAGQDRQEGTMQKRRKRS